MDVAGENSKFNAIKNLAADLSIVVEKLKVSEERFARALQATKDGIWEWNIVTNEEFFSPRWCEIIGYSFDDPELLHTFDSWASRIHPDDKEYVLAAVKAHLEENKEYNVEYRHLHKSGEYRFQNSRGQAVFDDKGKPVKMVGCIRDITDKKNLEKQLLQSQKLESVGQLAAGIAHDFNNILGIIAGQIDIMQHKIKNSAIDPGKLSNRLESMKESVKRGLSIVKELLGFAREGEFITKNVDVSYIIKSVISLLNRTILTHYITYQTDLKKNILADSTQIFHALQNLILNARDATPDGGEIKVIGTDKCFHAPLIGPFFTIPAGDYVEIRVVDEGGGIEPDIIEKVFDPFFTTKERSKGTGLGLSMVYGIVKNHHGYITIETEIGKGTTFHLYFPAIEPNIDLATNSMGYQNIEDELYNSSR